MFSGLLWKVATSQRTWSFGWLKSPGHRRTGWREGTVRRLTRVGYGATSRRSTAMSTARTPPKVESKSATSPLLQLILLSSSYSGTYWSYDACFTPARTDQLCQLVVAEGRTKCNTLSGTGRREVARSCWYLWCCWFPWTVISVVSFGQVNTTYCHPTTFKSQCRLLQIKKKEFVCSYQLFR